MTPAESLRTPGNVCTFVDALGHGAIGRLDVRDRSGERLGAVFVQESRVCWVVACGMAARLRSLLIEHACVDAHVVERHVERCRNLGLELTRELVARGVIAAGAMREVLATHSAECLVGMTRADAVGHWVPRPRAYAPRYTFSTTELLVRAGASTHPTGACWFTEHRQRTLEELARGGWSAAFVRIPGLASPAPVAVVGAYPTNAAELLFAGRWGAGAVDVASVVADGRAHVCIRTEAGDPDRTMFALEGEAGFLVCETDADGRARLVGGGRGMLIDDNGGVL